MSPSFLATYGTLMRAFDQHRSLGVDEDLVFVGECRWTGHLYDLGAVPGAVPNEEGILHGELFRVKRDRAWRVIDRYEGYDAAREEASPYVRRRVSLEAPSTRTAWVYWYNGDVDGAPRVPSGDWAAHVQSRTDAGGSMPEEQREKGEF